MRKDVSLKVV